MPALEPERKKQRLELLSTILLSLAAVSSALSAYQASRWYSEMNVNLGLSSTIRADAAVADREANRQMLADMISFLEWTQRFRNKDDGMMLALEDRFSEPLKKAFTEWKGIPVKGAAGLLPKGTPMELPSYSLPIQEKSKELVKNSEEKFALAKKAAQIGDDFIFSLVIFSLSLFFGAICTKLDRLTYQIFLWCAGTVILVVGVITIASLPWNIGF
jgi:hypothetical protein